MLVLFGESFRRTVGGPGLSLSGLEEQPVARHCDATPRIDGRMKIAEKLRNGTAYLPVLSVL
jgi:hypothetical protein